MLFWRSRKRRIVCVTCVVLTLLLLVSIPVKEAIDIEIAEDGQMIDINSLVGHKVTLLCEHSDMEVTDAADYNFVVLAALNPDGTFIPVFDSKESISHRKGLYVYPSFFIGGAVQKYNWGNRNLFVFNGALERAIANDGVDFSDAYRLNLSSWDIAYPVYHWEGFLHPDIDFYRRNLFVLDYL